MTDNKGDSDLDVFDGLGRDQPELPELAAPSSPPELLPLPLGSSSPPASGVSLSSRPKMLQGGLGKLPPPSVPSLPSNKRTLMGTGVLPLVSVPPSKPLSESGPPASGVLPPPAPPPVLSGGAGGAPSVEVEWEDGEDEKTQVFDKQSSDDIVDAIMQPLPAAGAPASGAAALLGRSGAVANATRAHGPVSVPPPEPLHSVPPGANATVLQVPGKGASTMLPWVLVGVLAVLLVVGAIWYLFSTATGELRVYVAGPNGRDIGRVEVFVDEQKVCSSSPCTVRELTPGIHDVRVESVGYEPSAPKGVTIQARAQAKLEIELTVASVGTGFTVTSSQQGIKLFVDGNEVGPLPQTLKNLGPGQHKLRFVGSDRYQPVDKTVNVIPGKLEDLGEIKLPVVRGKATLQLVTRGARILLVPSQGDKRLIDENMFQNDTLSIDIDTSKQWSIEATKSGFDILSLPISFADGVAEKTFRIELVEKSDDAAQTADTRPAVDQPAAQRSSGRRHVSGRARSQPTSSKSDESAEANTGASSDKDDTATAPAAQGKLNMNSIPPSGVVLDGRPLGSTPQIGIPVSPGSHTVLFVHPEKGRKSVSVHVGPGETKTASVKFD